MIGKAGKIVSNNLFMLGYAVRFTPGYLILVCLFEVYSSVEVFFEFTYCTRYMMDLIQYGGTFSDALRYMAVITAAILIKIVWSAVQKYYVMPVSMEKLNRRVRSQLFDKAVTLDLACYDDPPSYNDFVWCVGEANRNINQTIDNLGRLCRVSAAAVCSGVFFIAFDATGFLFVAASLCISLVLNAVNGRQRFETDAELQPEQRKRSYISRVFYLNDYSREIRMNPVARKLKADFDAANRRILGILDGRTGKQVATSFLSEFLADAVILDCLYLIYLLYVGLVRGLLSYGGIVSLYGASMNLKNSLRVFSELLPKFRESSLYIDKVRTFLSSKNSVREADGALEVPRGPSRIAFDDVSFAYGGSEDRVLKNVSLAIEPGEKVAFVGFNGAGKTTMIKLLMRLYDPAGGVILLGGRNIREYRLGEYRNLFGSVFQDFRIYAATVGENVMMDVTGGRNADTIVRALESSGFASRLSSMEKGIDTHLTREFDLSGTELSGGEAQKLAIARVFAKESAIIILDEPSSALDPISEYNLNETMLKAAGDKTVIFISHRLSTTMAADRIYMFEKGRIIESGSHDELIARDGAYARMFNLQAEKYRSRADWYVKKPGTIRVP